MFAIKDKVKWSGGSGVIDGERVFLHSTGDYCYPVRLDKSFWSADRCIHVSVQLVNETLLWRTGTQLVDRLRELLAEGVAPGDLRREFDLRWPDEAVSGTAFRAAFEKARG